VQKGAKGGREAVHLLKIAATSHIQDIYDGPPTNFRILIRVFANTKGLAKTYKDARILSDGKELESFMRGFNMADPHCEFIDAGDGKECSDRKLEGLFAPFTH